MNVEGGGDSTFVVLAEGATRDRVREVTEIGAARRRDSNPAPARGSQRQLAERSGPPVYEVRDRGGRGVAVPRATNGEETGVVLVALLQQDVEGPLATGL